MSKINQADVPISRVIQPQLMGKRKRINRGRPGVDLEDRIKIIYFVARCSVPLRHVGEVIRVGASNDMQNLSENASSNQNAARCVIEGMMACYYDYAS